MRTVDKIEITDIVLQTHAKVYSFKIKLVIKEAAKPPPIEKSEYIDKMLAL